MPYLGELCALLTAVLWPGSALTFARASTRINPLEVSIIRLGIAFGLIAVAHTSIGAAAAIIGTVPVVMLPMVKFTQKERLPRNAIVGALLATASVTILFER
jgi:drug/metabolite transporter (DMT)-like permease